MKLKAEFIIHNTDGESLLVATGAAEFSGIVRGNATAGAIIACLERDVTEEEIVDKLAAEYDAPRERIAAGVRRVVEQLRSIGAIDD